MSKLTTLEQEVIEALIVVNVECKEIFPEDAEILREQLKSAGVKERNITGAGFFTDLDIPSSVRRLSKRNKFRIAEVSADIEDVKDGAGFLLLMEDGALNQLEGYTMALEKWSPREGEKFKLKKIVYAHKDATGKYGGKAVDLEL